MYRYIFDVLPPKCTGTFLTYKKGLNVQYIFAGPPPLRGGDATPVVFFRRIHEIRPIRSCGSVSGVHIVFLLCFELRFFKTSISLVILNVPSMQLGHVGTTYSSIHVYIQISIDMCVYIYIHILHLYICTVFF